MGKVTDFIDLKYFANFNVADIIITVSAAFLVAFHFFHERKSGIRK
ncbi:MAG: signal peptidase II [Patescibacteria group bacterium]